MDWFKKEYDYNPSRLQLTGEFSAQVQNVMDNVRLTRGQVDDLSKLFFDLQRSLQWVWPGCQVLPFGSIVTGLGIYGSDVDVYVEIPRNFENDQARSVMKARNALRKHMRIFPRLFAITTAKVPILKLYHAPTDRLCDVSFKSQSGVRNSKLIAYLLQMDSRALPLCVLLKYWSKVHKLTGTNLLPNYALTMLTIFYMQQKNILPSVSILQNITNQKFFVDNWNTAFTENYRHITDNNQNVYELLGDFFKFYNNFDFEKLIVSPFLGDSIPRAHFAELRNIPKEFNYYKRVVADEGFSTLKIDSPICIQDVFEHNRNCAVAVYPRLAQRLKLHFQLAAKIYAENDSRHFLRLILEKKPHIPNPAKRKRIFKANDNKEIIPSRSTEEVTGNKESDSQEPPKNLKRPGESLTNLYFAIRSNKKKKMT